MKIVTGIILTSVAAFSGVAYAADAQPTTGSAAVMLEHVRCDGKRQPGAAARRRLQKNFPCRNRNIWA